MYVHNFDPVLFDFGLIEIRYYGVFFAVLFLLSYMIANWYLRFFNKSVKDVDFMFFACFLGVLIGARLGHVFFYEWQYYSQNLINILFVWRGGLASHGAVIGLVAAIYLIKRRTGFSYLFLGDLIALCGSLAVVFVRMGNFINAEIVGRITNVPWAVVFPCTDFNTVQCGLEPRHPSQLYEAFLGLGLFLFLFLLLKKFKSKIPSGLIASLFLILYFGGRFLLEFYKEYSGDLFFPPFTNGQVLSIPMVLIGIAVLGWVRGKRVNHQVT